MTVVGDDAQAIYGFRAATSAAILAFPTRYADTAVVRLEHNYRSTSPILEVANQLMAEGPTGATKTLWSDRPGRRRPLLRTCSDEASQAEAVCDSVLGQREAGVALKSQAVLFRAAHHATTLELALGRRRIPYVKYGGLRFVEAAHVKDLLALLRLLDNPWDELAWFRVLRSLEGVGPTTAGRVMGQLGVRLERTDRDGSTASDPRAASPLTRLLAAAPTVPEPAREEMGGPGRRWATAAAAARVARRRSGRRSSGSGAGWSPSCAGATTQPGRAAATSSASPSRRRRPAAGAGSWPTSRSTRPYRPVTWPVRPRPTTTGSCCRRSTPPRGASGTSCT